MSYIDQITVGSATYDIYSKQVNGHTVATDVPANAVFTDTTYTPASATPLMDGSGAVGTSSKYAREDHRHPSDTTKFGVGSKLFTTNPFLGKPEMHDLYISKIDNAFYAADKRWNVSATVNGTSYSNVAQFFNGNYEEDSKMLQNGATGIITLDFSNASGSKFPGYPYGYIYISFYYGSSPKSISGRVYNNYSSQGVGWKDITFTQVTDNKLLWVARQAYYGLQTLEITIVGETENAYGHTSPCEIEMYLDRPDPRFTPFLSKYGAETLYYNLTAPGFIGDLTGNASTATKATQDESGNNIKSSYGASLGISGSVLTLKNKNSAALSSVTLPAAPVTSVNNKTGAVVLTASDVGALPTTTSIPAAYTATPAALGTASAGSSPSWARGDHVHAKPTYSKSDVGLGNVDNVKQYSASNPPPYPVTSVNGSTGAVTITLPSIATAAPKDLASAASVGASTKYAKEDHIHKYPTPAQIGAGTYSKPSGGIPATDLASGVIPSAYTSNPAALGAASPGSSTSWARGDHVHAKPTYGKSDVGLGNVDNVKQYSASNPPPYPVTSVNGSTGAVSINAVPAGGSEGQVLAKTSSGYGWVDMASTLTFTVENENLSILQI